jgi:hypothetical protein
LYSNLCQEKYTSKRSQLGYIYQNTLSWLDIYTTYVIFLAADIPGKTAGCR